MEKGQAPSAGSELEIIEVTGQEKEEQEAVGQATSRGAREANPIVAEETEAEVPLVRKRRRLTKVGDIVPAWEGASSEEVVAAMDGAGQREDGREVGEDASAQEGSQSGDGAEEAPTELPWW